MLAFKTGMCTETAALFRAWKVKHHKLLVINVMLLEPRFGFRPVFLETARNELFDPCGRDGSSGGFAEKIQIGGTVVILF